MQLLSGRRPRLALGSLVQLQDRDDPRRSDATLLAASILALNIPPAEAEFFFAVYQSDGRGGVEWRSIWNFREDSTCGRFNSRQCITRWSDGNWLVANSTHPLAILRSGLTYKFALQLTPRFNPEQLRRVETPDTWLEAAARNLVYLLRDIPQHIRQAARGLVQFGPEHIGAPPRCMSEASKARFLNYVEKPGKRHQLARA